MAVVSALRDPDHLRALVDMGSNGIRFSISSLQGPTARIMPTLYQHRVGISLYDAQHGPGGESMPIDDQTISNVITSFKQFQRTCRDFGVKEANVTILATEATRTAKNSEVFRGEIKMHTGWEVQMLSKEEEGRVGAMGIASSLPEVSGLVMDLGGGSTQLSWLVKKNDRSGVQMPEAGAVSMPYGAAAMSQRLAKAHRDGTVSVLKQEIKETVKKAYESLHIPQELQDAADAEGGFALYLSGGGFRGWGYVLMKEHQIRPYPIPVINGFKVTREDFLRTDLVQQTAAQALDDSGESSSIFQVSDRRASQVPAVAFLVNALAEALPKVKEVRFCQGGVREGFLFASLPSEVQAQHPLVVATQPFDSPLTSEWIALLLQSALPVPSSHGRDNYADIFTTKILDTFGNMIYYHSSHSSDLQATSALRSTTSGVLAGVHGVIHEDRALIALLLCARWGNNVPPADVPFKANLERIIQSPWTLWWSNYLGAVAALIAAVYPAGVPSREQERVKFQASWVTNGEHDHVLDLRITLAKDISVEIVDKNIRVIEKTGKRKRWIGGRDGVGYKVTVHINS